ncbi:hypothetical protein C0J52_07324 [Blattella germanica]|nr:hypothetical protein C0J52_07324 [Blattella germanica]
MRQSRASRLDQVGKTSTLQPPKIQPGGRSRSNSSSAGGVGGSLSPHHLLRVVRSAVTGSDAHISQDESPQRGGGPDECYVPGAGDLMPILLGASHNASTPTETRVPANGDAVFPKDNHHHHHHHHHHHDEHVQTQAYEEDDDDDLEMSSFPMPEMRDNECQTRESLFMNTNSDRSLTPPPPPPPMSSRGSHRHPSRPTPQQVAPTHHSSSNASAFSTFGYREQPPPRQESGSSNVKDSTSTLPHQHHHHNHHRHQHPESKHFRAEAVIEMEQTSPGKDSVPPPPPPANRPFSVESTKSAPDVIVTH